MNNHPTQNPETECPIAYEGINNIHALYASVLESIVSNCKRSGVWLEKHAIQCMMESFVDGIADDADKYIAELHANGYYYSVTPEDSEKQINDAYESLVDSFRLKAPKLVSMEQLFSRQPLKDKQHGKP